MPGRGEQHRPRNPRPLRLLRRRSKFRLRPRSVDTKGAIALRALRPRAQSLDTRAGPRKARWLDPMKLPLYALSAPITPGPKRKGRSGNGSITEEPPSATSHRSVAGESFRVSDPPERPIGAIGIAPWVAETRLPPITPPTGPTFIVFTGRPPAIAFDEAAPGVVPADGQGPPLAKPPPVLEIGIREEARAP
jgi:hypothetical protein